MTAENQLTFLKLGGSLITDKHTPLTARPTILARIANEIAAARHDNPGLLLLIGHGSGSFGHAVAEKYHTANGVHTQQGWWGFADVWQAARQLNELVIRALIAADLPVISFPPSAGVIAENRQVDHWDSEPLQHALKHNLIPLVQGDVIFDRRLGGTIFSTEIIFQYLAKRLRPHRILLAGLDEGVWVDAKDKTEIVSKITPENVQNVLPLLDGAETVDVTGGMRAKVQTMLTLVEEIPSLNINIFSGAQPGAIYNALSGAVPGTRITRSDIS